MSASSVIAGRSISSAGGRLRGKTALVTGASTGIGLASAKLFAAEGAQTFITGRRMEQLTTAAEAIGNGVVAVRGDVSNLNDLSHLYETLQKEAGHIDVLFANAGGGQFATLSEVTEDHYNQTFDTNVRGTLFTVQKALPLLTDGASIILTGSTASLKGTPAFSVYSASKAAIRNFARSWILELAPRGIRVNVLAPGATSTPGWHDLASSTEHEKLMIDHTVATTPLGRLGRVDEIAEVALFLASDQSSFVNGVELFADGGSAQI